MRNETSDAFIGFSARRFQSFYGACYIREIEEQCDELSFMSQLCKPETHVVVNPLDLVMMAFIVISTAYVCAQIASKLSSIRFGGNALMGQN